MTSGRAEPQPAASLERKTFFTRGSSMLPSIPPGSEVCVTRADPVDIRCGDVVGYPGPRGTMVMHRVVQIRKEGMATTFVVRGDGQSQSEELPASAVTYRAVRVRLGSLSYGTDGVVGGIMRQLAMQRGLAWRVATRAARLAVRLISRTVPRLQRDEPEGGSMR